MTKTRRTMLVQTNPTTNNNKFYEVTMGADGTVHARWGRVGATGQSGTKGSGDYAFDRAVMAKKAKGYVEVDVLGTEAANTSTSREALARASHEQLAGSDPTLADLVERLVAINAHTIKAASGGQITVSADSGVVSTPLGVLSPAAVRRAKVKLADMQSGYTTDDLREYLMMVPQRVPARGGWHDEFFTKVTSFKDQADLLDQLEQSVQFAASQAQAKVDTPNDLFRYRLSQVKDRSTLATLRKRFSGSANANHVTSSAKITRVFELTDNRRADEVAKAAKSVGNVRPMWHGSRAANVLSILSSGLYVPPSSAGFVTGRMFGDGIYLSEQSTKSLNYSRGGVWSSGVDNQFFMFAADVAMGHEYRPNIHGQSHMDYERARSGAKKDGTRRFDSINVKAGTCGVRNHEAIVWNPDQINMRYLIEFSA